MSNASHACPYGYCAALIKARIRELDSLIKDEIAHPSSMKDCVKAWQAERVTARAHLAKMEAIGAGGKAAAKASVASLDLEPGTIATTRGTTVKVHSRIYHPGDMSGRHPRLPSVEFKFVQ